MRHMSTVRLAKSGDAAGVLQIYGKVVTHSHASFETSVPTEDEMAERISGTLTRLPWLVAESGGEIVAYAYAASLRARPAYQWSCEVSVYVADGNRGGGAATQLYRALFRILVRLGYRMAFAAIALPNPASVAFHEKLGFEATGRLPAAGFKHGAWVDIGWWALQLQPLLAEPAGPLRMNEQIGRAHV